ncbi:hypothetical protein COU59_02275 [Candidatus Pacearchaeota archaeon CG10_big_fil_rev_8_21_14_0_10_34_12]|nr:MAG: hypothetical protein COU59_02275 [Candidatus Pacearchaeota archaeon CG10_big_fil_rev_8_21_14_0_10_34_12]
MGKTLRNLALTLGAVGALMGCGNQEEKVNLENPNGRDICSINMPYEMYGDSNFGVTDADVDCRVVELRSVDSSGKPVSKQVTPKEYELSNVPRDSQGRIIMTNLEGEQHYFPPETRESEIISNCFYDHERQESICWAPHRK